MEAWHTLVLLVGWVLVALLILSWFRRFRKKELPTYAMDEAYKAAKRGDVVSLNGREAVYERTEDGRELFYFIDDLTPACYNETTAVGWIIEEREELRP